MSEQTREGISKAYIPKFLYKPPFGYPRYANLDYVRYLAQTPYVDMCISTIIEEINSIEREVVPNKHIPKKMAEKLFYDEEGNLRPEVQAEINHIKFFLDNPNTNKETFEDVFISMAIRDVLEVNSGIINKVFNLKEEMVELVARDGATFTRNPDIHGMYTNRKDLILPKPNQIFDKISEVVNPFRQTAAPLISEQAAYFQYGWISGPVPVPFGKREIIWLEKMKRSDDIYGYSPIQILANSLQMLLYQIQSDLEYYNDNNVPKGIIGLDSSDTDEIKAFKEQWNEIQQTKDEFGNWKKTQHKVPILNYIPKFERIEFSSSELQLIEKQKWYSKLIWACFGVTSTELGYTEDAQGQANQIVQSKVFKKKAINPMLKKLSNAINMQVIPEFDYNVKIKIGKKDIEVPKYEFLFKTFDVDMETSKATLFEKWVDNGIRTVNEIRTMEGLDPVEWGNDKPKKFRDENRSINFGGNAPGQEKEDQEVNDNSKEPNPKEPEDNQKKVEKQLENQKSIEGKPFGEYDTFEQCVRQNSDKNDPEAYCAQVHKEITGEWPSEKAKKKDFKALTPENPLALRENEVPDEDKLMKALKYLLKINEKKIIKACEKELKENKLKVIKSSNAQDFESIEIKGLNDVIKTLEPLISSTKAKKLAMQVIRHEFLKGAKKAEEDINKIKAFNYAPDTDAIKYISEYTFDNIKGMEEDLENKLRQQLSIAFMNGEGIDKVKKRIRDSFDVSENRAETIARTESSRAHSFGKLSAYKESGIKVKKWLLWTDDHRTSEITKALHKKYGSPEKAIELDKNFKATVKVGKKVVNIDQAGPPFHPNERDILMFEPQV